MNTSMEEIKEYFEGNPIHLDRDNFRSVSEFLYWHYAGSNSIETEVIRERFKAINATMRHMTIRQQDTVLDLVHAVCEEYEKNAFQEGFHIGVRLMMELREMEQGSGK